MRGKDKADGWRDDHRVKVLVWAVFNLQASESEFAAIRRFQTEARRRREGAA